MLNELDNFEEKLIELTNLNQLMDNALEYCSEYNSNIFHLTSLSKIITNKSEILIKDLDRITCSQYK